MKDTYIPKTTLSIDRQYSRTSINKRAKPVLNEKSRVSSNALELLNYIMKLVFLSLIEELVHVKYDEKTVEQVIEKAIEKIVPLNEITKHINQTKTNILPTRTTKDILFDLSIDLERDDKNDDTFDLCLELRESKKAISSFTRLAEYLVTELIELSGNAAKDHKRTTIMVLDVFLVLVHDEELQVLVFNLMVPQDFFYFITSYVCNIKSKGRKRSYEEKIKIIRIYLTFYKQKDKESFKKLLEENRKKAVNDIVTLKGNMLTENENQMIVDYSYGETTTDEILKLFTNKK